MEICNYIDWDGLFRAKWAERHSDKDFGSGEQFWNERAEEFYERIVQVENQDMIEKVIERLPIEPDDVVYDLGCGPGTLTIPLAKKVEKVIAVDISEGMLRILRRRVQDEGLTNVDISQGRWIEKAVEELEPADVVISFRSLGHLSCDKNNVPHMMKCLAMMNEIARREVCIITPATAYGRKVSEQTKDKSDILFHRFGYIDFYNMLYALGIIAKIDFIEVKIHHTFTSFEEALEFTSRYFAWTELEKERKKELLEKALNYDNNIYYLDATGLIPFTSWSKEWNTIKLLKEY